jgi:hypothetical protein
MSIRYYTCDNCGENIYEEFIHFMHFGNNNLLEITICDDCINELQEKEILKFIEVDEDINDDEVFEKYGRYTIEDIEDFGGYYKKTRKILDYFSNIFLEQAKILLDKSEVFARCDND